MGNKVLCLMGPTASGKTALACALSDRFPVDLISVDSAMIYRGMDIGTAKPNLAELTRYPHALIDIRNPNETFSVAEFCTLVDALCRQSLAASRIPVLVGGTMMYFNALQQGLSELPAKNDALRQQLAEEARDKGWPAMYAQLITVDPLFAGKIKPQDSQRILRGLEVFYHSGKPMSQFLQESKQALPYEWINVILFPEDRAVLHAAISQRFHQMLQQGLLDEVRHLVTQWDLTAESPTMRMVGYRQAYDYLLDPKDYTHFCEKGIAATRQLAKRQLTWLRQWPETQRYTYDRELHLLDRVSVVVESMMR